MASARKRVTMIFMILSALPSLAVKALARPMEQTAYYTVDSKILPEDCAKALKKNACKTTVSTGQRRAIAPPLGAPPCFALEGYPKEPEQAGSLIFCEKSACSSHTLQNPDNYRTFRQIETTYKFGIVERVFATLDAEKTLSYVGILMDALPDGTNKIILKSVVHATNANKGKTPK